MNEEEKSYLDLLNKIMCSGESREDRTCTGTYSLFGEKLTFDLQNGFPLLTTKRVNIKAIIYELLWFLRGDTNIKWLNDRGVHIWDEWADKYGNLGPIYGEQWRNLSKEEDWGGPGNSTSHHHYDQIKTVIDSINYNPVNRRHIVSSWNVIEIEDMALPPCHCLFQFYVRRGSYLDCQLYQRSADIFLGVPFNIASYALLTIMIAQVCGLKPGKFNHIFGDVHLYKNHVEQAKLQITRTPSWFPTMNLDEEIKDIDKFDYHHFNLTCYNPYPAIKAEVSV